MNSRFSIPFAATIVLLSILFLTACAAAVQPAVQVADVPSEVAVAFANPEVLVDTAWISEQADDAGVRLLDVSSSQETYDTGHLPGAHYVNWRSDLINPDNPVDGQILSGEALSALLSDIGVNNGDTLVVYDDTSNLFAARAYWALKYYQHPDVRLYDGGSKKWRADGQALTTDVPEVEPTEYAAAASDPAIRTSWQDVVDSVDDPSTLFCDTRGPKEYNGTNVRADRGGHIPGAINLEWSAAVNDDGTFRSAEDLSELYAKAGFSPDKNIVTYCQTGVRGAHTWFVLSELLGYPEVRNFDGSWQEYGNNADSPIES